MPPRLSVVVPFYGVENYIRDCLDSIRAQTVRDIEVILVDDGSLDGSASVAQEVCESDDRFTIVTQPNAGLGPARNTGAAVATGEYLTFVDSDDLVTVHGFARLVDGLDRSGSSFAGGNAKRFSNSLGVRQSWSHRNAFAQTKKATHITERPSLARDRMVWNKVYRRSFWDQFAYSFPAIRYEDYPVTLKAHLDALTVDVHSTAVYFWRERESGDSITQQRFNYGNLLDRVVSAELVLDLLGGATAAVRKQVVDALGEADLLTLMQAFAPVPDNEADRLLGLARRLADRLGDESVRGRHVYDRIQYSALRAGDVGLLRELAVFRGAGGLRGWARGERAPRLPWRLEFPYPGLGSASVPRKLYMVPRKQVGLRTVVLGAQWSDAGLRVRATAEIRHVPTTTGSRVSVRFGEGAHATDVPVERFFTRDSHGDPSLTGLAFTLTHAALKKAMARGTSIDRIHVSVRSGTHSSHGLLRGVQPGSAQSPSGAWLDDHTWAQPTTTNSGDFVINWLTDPARLTDVIVHDGVFGLTVQVPEQPELPALTIAASRLAPLVTLEPVHTEVSTPGTGHQTLCTMTFELPVEEIVRHAAYDDPFRQSTVRGVHLRDGKSAPQLVLWTAPPHEAGAAQNEHLVSFTRSRGGRVNLVEGPVRLVADEVCVPAGLLTVADDRIVVSGRNWLGHDDLKLSWRRFRPNSDEHIDVRCEVSFDEETGSRWTASAPLPQLLDVPVVQSVYYDPLSTLADWSLFVTWPGHAESVVLEGTLHSRLPLEVSMAERTALVQPYGDILHVKIRTA